MISLPWCLATVDEGFRWTEPAAAGASESMPVENARALSLLRSVASGLVS